MTNNDELALKLKVAAMAEVNRVTGVQPAYWDLAKPELILALLAERDAKDKRISELEQKAEIYDMLRTDYELEGSLVDFVDWQAKRIEMLEKYTNERDAENQGLMLTIGKLREEREERTVNVKPAEEYPDDFDLQAAINMNDDYADYQTAQWLKELRRRRATMQAEPVNQRYTLPPHIYRELVNQLRDTAVKYQGCQQLREQLSETLSTVITPAAPEQKEGSA